MKNLINLTEMENLITKDALKKFDKASKVIFDDLEIEGFEVKQVEDFFKQRLQLLFESNELHDDVVKTGNVFQLQADAKELIDDVSKTLKDHGKYLELLLEVLDALEVDSLPLNIFSRDNAKISDVKIEVDYEDNFFVVPYKGYKKCNSLKFDNIDDCVEWLIDNKCTEVIK